MGITGKRVKRFFFRRYALIGALFRFDKKARRAFRESIDDKIIETFRTDIEDFIARYPNVFSDEKTIQLIKEKNRSFCRFGDGEFKLIIGEVHKSFQDVDPELNRRMLEVLNSNENNILIGINSLESFDQIGRVWRKFIIRIGDKVLQLLDTSRNYPSSLVFRQLPTNNKEAFIQKVKLIKSIWEKRDILLVVGKNSRFLYEDEIFNNAASVSYVYGPAKNAFNEYDKLMSEIRKYDKDKYLVLPVLGPTATIMAYDLAKEGYQAIDFGQMPGQFRKAKAKLYGDPDFEVKELAKNA